MNYDNDLDDTPSRRDADPPEREISLGTATILGIFLLLALVCAAFFGFGYSLGRHATPPATQASVPPASDLKPDTTFSNFKTAPSPDTDQPEAPAPTKAATPAPKLKQEAVQTEPVPAQPAATNAPAVRPGQFVVQISAPSRQSDADHLVAVLQQKGYTAFVRKESQDSFFHVQLGPFATKPEAQAMLKRLDADGYKPFIK